jgi:hypothetical protein
LKTQESCNLENYINQINDSSEQRVIVELSFPEGESVNFGILKDEYFGNKISVSYPKVDDFINLIM